MKLRIAVLIFLESDLIDDSGLDIDFKAGFEEQRDVVEGETKHEEPEFMFHHGSVVDVARFQQYLGLLQQLLCLFSMRYQFLFGPVHLGL